MKRNHDLFMGLFFSVFAGIALVTVGALVPVCINMHSSIFDRYNLIGTVDGNIGAKLMLVNKNGSTKYSVPLVVNDFKRIVNCTSTQCASLSTGDRVELSCYEEWHVVSPSEEECRFTNLR